MMFKKTKLLDRIISFIIKYFSGFDFYLTNHNGIYIEDYPEKKWYLVPFPSQKGMPYNHDNLSTVNRHSFIDEPRFNSARLAAEARWKTNPNESVRNISWRLHTLLWAASIGLKNIDIESEIFVECGTGKGYMAAGICDFFKWDNLMPSFYLIDSFKPTMPDEDGEQIKDGKKLFVYADGDLEVRTYFSKYPNIEVIKGVIPSILDELPTNKIIKFLHLDLNSHIAEEQALENLTDRFIAGSVILFDDYGGFGGEKQAIIHETFAKKNNKSLLVLPTGQALVIW
jgi:hypothetical protein